MLDILIINGSIIDGSGAPAYKGHIGIKEGKIVSCTLGTAANHVIDAKGRIVCPGFIDAHSHGDRLLGTPDGRLFKTSQGITTELCGQCGVSEAPISKTNLREMYDFFRYIHDFDRIKNWTSYEKFFNYVNECQLSANAKFYVGHRTLRMAVMGLENRAPTPKELETMQSILRESMEAGAAGFTTGMVYVPGCYAQEDEIVALAKVISRYDGIYASHMRNESFGVVDAVKETINVGRKANVRVDISHHKVMGRSNWGKQRETLELINRANEEGIHTTCDQYPYTRNMSTLRATIPSWYLTGGRDALSERLKEREFRWQLRKEMEDPNTPYDNYYLNAGGWDGVYITSAQQTKDAEGKTLSDYAKGIGMDPWDTFFDIMIQNNCVVNGVYSSMSEDDICDIIMSPYCVVGTDGYTDSWSYQGHPRASATFPHAINFYVKDKKILSLEKMIHKMTGLTAERLLVKNKGFLRDGYDADVLVFNYENLKDLSTYDDSNRLTEGLDYVIVNGEIVYKDMKFTGVYPGKLIKHS